MNLSYIEHQLKLNHLRVYISSYDTAARDVWSLGLEDIIGKDLFSSTIKPNNAFKEWFYQRRYKHKKYLMVIQSNDPKNELMVSCYTDSLSDCFQNCFE